MIWYIDHRKTETTKYLNKIGKMDRMMTIFKDERWSSNFVVSQEASQVFFTEHQMGIKDDCT